MKKYLISICICTYKRPILLNYLLYSLAKQKVDDKFAFEIIITDNDANRTGENIIRDFQKKNNLKVIYDCEPVQNISMARNRAVANAQGDLIAFIDDDEFADPEWLKIFFDTYQKYKVDGVLGPVKPVYEGVPPDWLVKNRFCDRDSFLTGTILDNIRFMRTGNLIFSRYILEGLEKPFDPGLGLTGGEDVDFFSRMLKSGRIFVWCDEAVVFELVPKERQQLRYHIRRAILRGLTNSNRERLVSRATAKSIAAVLSYTACLPVFMAINYPLFLRYLVKDCGHFAKLLGHSSIKLIKKRNF